MGCPAPGSCGFSWHGGVQLCCFTCDSTFSWFPILLIQGLFQGCVAIHDRRHTRLPPTWMSPPPLSADLTGATVLLLSYNVRGSCAYCSASLGSAKECVVPRDRVSWNDFFAVSLM